MPNCCYSCSNDCNGCVKEIVNAQTLLRAVYFEGNTAFFEKQESPKNRLYSEFCIYICNVAFRFAINQFRDRTCSQRVKSRIVVFRKFLLHARSGRHQIECSIQPFLHKKVWRTCSVLQTISYFSNDLSAYDYPSMAMYLGSSIFLGCSFGKASFRIPSSNFALMSDS